ncbi:hypothetical protein [Streptosporangium sp. V21-05]|uniref:hypothetical protein n=1 Tax=Streptosporangium sp. V21-05 TaxID=3446115 RepID=UPI003F53389A
MGTLLQSEHLRLGHEPVPVRQGGSGKVDHGGGITEISGQHRLVREGMADQLDVLSAMRHLQVDVEPQGRLFGHTRVLIQPSGEGGEART